MTPYDPHEPYRDEEDFELDGPGRKIDFASIDKFFLIGMAIVATFGGLATYGLYCLVRRLFS